MESELKLYKSNKTQGGSYFRSMPGSNYYNHGDVYDAIRKGKDVQFSGCNEGKELICVIRSREQGTLEDRKIKREIQGDTVLLNRIIRNGGYIEYITKLENMQ